MLVMTPKTWLAMANHGDHGCMEEVAEITEREKLRFLSRVKFECSDEPGHCSGYPLLFSSMWLVIAIAIACNFERIVLPVSRMDQGARWKDCAAVVLGGPATRLLYVSGSQLVRE